MSNISLATVLISGLLSIITGYVGSWINSWRQRSYERRVLGLAFLAEVKNVQRGLRRYLILLERLDDTELAGVDELGLEVRVRRWRHGISVYSNNAGRIGLFSIPTAIELMEFYFRLRMLEVRVDEVSGLLRREGVKVEDWLDEHRRLIRSAARHSRAVARLLRREVPLTAGELVHYMLRREKLGVLRRQMRRTTIPLDLHE